MVKGYGFSADWNKLNALPEFFEDGNRLRCPVCACLTDPFYRPLDLQYKGKLEVSVTYEGIYLVNERFRKFLINAGVTNVIFSPINSKGDFFYFDVFDYVATVDFEKSGITIGPVCDRCGNRSKVIGGVFKTFLADDFLSKDRIYVTNLFWRDHFSFSRNIVVGVDLAKQMKAEKFKGLSLSPSFF